MKDCCIAIESILMKQMIKTEGYSIENHFVVLPQDYTVKHS